MFAAQHKLANLTAIVDVNGQQALGYTREVLDLEPLGARWQSFGWEVREVDGHNHQAIDDALGGFTEVVDRPHVLLARTTFGKGVSFMEGRIEWHYLPMSDDEYQTAQAELTRSAA